MINVKLWKVRRTTATSSVLRWITAHLFVLWWKRELNEISGLYAPYTPRQRNMKPEPVLTLKTRQMFSVHNTPEEFKCATVTGHFWFGVCLRKTRSGLPRDYRDVIVSGKLRLKIVFCPYEKQSRLFQILPVWKAFSKSAVFVTD